MAETNRNREELSIIVVDDMKFSCEFIRKNLNKEGYGDIRLAASAKEALAQLEERPAEVILADWVMPEMDGLELTDRVRQIDEENHHYTCVILLTGRDDISSVIKAFDHGVDDYITKPPDKQELAARIYAAGRIAHLQNGLLDSMNAMRESYERTVTIDKTTGLGNRLDAERRLDELLSMVEARGGALCCGFFAIDNSKQLLDSVGEDSYQEVLRSVATRLSRTVRPNDVVARVSDSEFVVGMYFQNEAHVKARNFKRILQAINLRPVKTPGGFVTVDGLMSVSCSRRGDLYPQAEELMEAAARKIDQAHSEQSNGLVFL